jgi:TPR repeat protein
MWFNLSAAQSNLGLIYYNGNGVPQDLGDVADSILVIPDRGDDGARAIDDVGCAGAARATGSSTTDRKICSINSGGAYSRSRSAAAARH